MAFTGGIKKNFSGMDIRTESETGINNSDLAKAQTATNKNIKAQIYEVLKNNFSQMKKEQGIEITNLIYEIAKEKHERS